MPHANNHSHRKYTNTVIKAHNISCRFSHPSQSFLEGRLIFPYNLLGNVAGKCCQLGSIVIDC